MHETMKAFMALMGCAVLMNESIAAKDDNIANGLTASVLIDPKPKEESRRLILTNVGKAPVRICGLHQVWRHESVSQILLIVTSESFKSDAPTDRQLKESIKVLEPGMSFPIDLPFDLLSLKKDIQITYEVSENFAKKLDLWQGTLHLNFGSGLLTRPTSQ